MKRLSILVLVFASLSSVKAQTFNEWFKQKATQRKYLLEQIAALQVYVGYLQTGYSIARDGLNTISDIKNGEFDLHTNYFNSLKTVSPQIKNYWRVAEIIALQLRIVEVYRDAFGHIRQSGAFSGEEIRYLNAVFERLLDDCIKTVDELIAVTTSNELEMRDDERLKQIDKLHADMQGKYTFIQAFSGEANMLAVARSRERNEVETSRALHGIKR